MVILELHSLTENWISQRRHRQVKRRAHAAMALVQREVLRMRKRDWIREAKSISLSFDDRKAHKLVVFNCDMPLDHRGADGVPVRHGMVGCLDMAHGESAESMDEDYIVRTCEKTMAMIKKFATPLGESSPDAAVVAKFVDGTQSIVCDGAMQKTAVFLVPFVSSKGCSWFAAIPRTWSASRPRSRLCGVRDSRNKTSDSSPAGTRY